MKKVVIGLMTVLMMVVMVMVTIMVTATAENPTKSYVEVSEVYNMVEEFARTKYGDKIPDGLDSDNIYYTYGILYTSELKRLTGKDFSPETVEQLYKHCRMYGQKWDIETAKVTKIGLQNGYDVYELYIATNKVPLGTCCNTEYYKGNMTFMVYEDDKIEEIDVKEIEIKEIEVKPIEIN